MIWIFVYVLFGLALALDATSTDEQEAKLKRIVAMNGGGLTYRQGLIGVFVVSAIGWPLIIVLKTIRKLYYA